MLPPIFRQPEDNPPTYRKNTEFFTIEVHHSGGFYDKPNNVAYERVVLYLNFLHPAWFTKDNLEMFLQSLGTNISLEFYYRRSKMSLGMGLSRLESEDDVRLMQRGRDKSKVVEVYIVHAVQSHTLPFVGVPAIVDEQATVEEQAFERCYAPVLEEWNGETLKLVGGSILNETIEDL
ncbi:hypothetical protein Adt_18728 [Abeliophyllum distichum]|uniref:Uncharacterized protein n=1 Tax=Abeliophyllum distichum TaxID=126358 RepID=A0ABD1TKI9_9LAMI